MTQKTYTEQAWKNKIGQTINPGDKVLVITQGYGHSMYTRVGTFLGVNSKGQGTAVVAASTWKKVDGKYGYHDVQRHTTPYLQRIYALK